MEIGQKVIIKNFGQEPPTMGTVSHVYDNGVITISTNSYVLTSLHPKTDNRFIFINRILSPATNLVENEVLFEVSKKDEIKQVFFIEYNCFGEIVIKYLNGIKRVRRLIKPAYEYYRPIKLEPKLVIFVDKGDSNKLTLGTADHLSSAQNYIKFGNQFKVIEKEDTIEVKELVDKTTLKIDQEIFYAIPTTKIYKGKVAGIKPLYFYLLLPDNSRMKLYYCSPSKVYVPVISTPELEQCLYNDGENVKLYNIMSKPDNSNNIIIELASTPHYMREVSIYDIIKVKVAIKEHLNVGDIVFTTNNYEKDFIYSASVKEITNQQLKIKYHRGYAFPDNYNFYGREKIYIPDNSFETSVDKPTIELNEFFNNIKTNPTTELNELNIKEPSMKDLFAQLPTTEKELNKLKDILTTAQADIDSRLNFIKTSGAEEFDEDLYKVYTAIDTFNNANSSTLDKAKAVVEIFRD